MASPGALVKVVADVLGIPEVTVVQHDRNLATAGLRSKGGRGTSAAKMTAGDAANLLIATAASSLVKDSVETLAAYSKLQLGVADKKAWARTRKSARSIWNLLPRLRELNPDHSLGELLTALIADVADGQMDAAFQQEARFWRDRSGLIKVTFSSPDAACSVMFGASRPWICSYGDSDAEHRRTLALPVDEIDAARLRIPDLTQTRTFTAKTIFAVAGCLKN